jgi:hypothetical protein
VSALDLFAGLVLEDGRRWGEAAADFQWEDARAVLQADNTTPYHFLTRARGGSKTADLAGMSIAAMLAQLPKGSRLYGLAADRDQGRLLVDSIGGFVTRTPELKGALKVDAFRVVATRSGSVLEVLAADAPGAWGLRPSFLVVDELAQWATTPGPRQLWEAASSAIAKMPGARLAVLTTAGDPSHWAHGVLQHAKNDPLWRVHEVRGPAPWMDTERLAEQQRRLPESSYRRLFMNEWTAAEDRLTTVDDLAACTVLEGPIAPQTGCRYILAADLGLKSDRTVAVVCHGEPILNDTAATVGTRVVLDRIEVWQGTRAEPVKLADVEAWIAQASAAYNGAPVVLDPWQAVGLAQRLRAQGVHVDEFTFSSSSVGRLASTLHLLLRNRALALPNDPELLDELANVRLRETSPGVLRLDHDPDKHDDRAIALALAAHHLVERSTRVSRAGISGVVYRDYRHLQAPREPSVDEQIAAYHAMKAAKRARRETDRRREAASYRDPRTLS